MNWDILDSVLRLMFRCGVALLLRYLVWPNESEEFDLTDYGTPEPLSPPEEMS